MERVHRVQLEGKRKSEKKSCVSCVSRVCVSWCLCLNDGGSRSSWTKDQEERTRKESRSSDLRAGARSSSGSSWVLSVYLGYGLHALVSCCVCVGAERRKKRQSCLYACASQSKGKNLVLTSQSLPSGSSVYRVSESRLIHVALGFVFLLCCCFLRWNTWAAISLRGRFRLDPRHDSHPVHCCT